MALRAIAGLGGGGGESKHVCLTWLDSQPKGSVVFLSFGSEGVFSYKQLVAIANGLQISGVRFLWVVRNRTTLNSDLNEILPPGFMNRTQERGFVVKQWAPQVLNHESVGGFVTHCGWNSVLESLCAGVPMVGWPLYADQKLANHFMVLEMRVALELKMDESPLAVTADELAKRVTELMTETVSGKAVRDRVAAMKEEAVAAISDGGSSDVALTKLVESLKRA